MSGRAALGHLARVRGAAMAIGLSLAVAAAPRVNAQASPSAPAANDTLTSAFEVAGIDVILRRVTANNVVAANVYLLGGVQQLTPATQGIELLLLEAAEAGSRRYPRDIARERLATLGSTIAANAGTDWTTLGMRSTLATFDSTWALLADRLANPTLAADDVARVRDRILSAVRQRREDPDALLTWLSDSMAFAGHPYSLSPVGTEATLPTLDSAALRDYHARTVTRSRLLVVIVGNLDEARVRRAVAAGLGSLPAGEYAWSLPIAPAPFRSDVVTQSRRLPTNYLQGWFLGPRADQPDYVPLRLACAILSGRLFAEVRERRNLTYAVNAPFADRAISTGGLYVTTVAPDAVARIMQAEMQALQQGTISSDGLQRLVQQFIVTYYLDNETNADQADLLARAQLYQGDWRRANAFVDELRAVTPEMIRAAAARWFRGVRWAYIGDPFRLDRRVLTSF